MSFQAEIGALTRTTLDGVRVQWESGDELDILSGAGVVTYVATPLATDARKAVFTKKNPSDPEPTPLPEAYGIGKYAALYPSGIVSMIITAGCIAHLTGLLVCAFIKRKTQPKRAFPIAAGWLLLNACLFLITT